ncbi:MAG: GNAT family N-acetyltransferase [Lachnospiraceae bacterium]|nr:GNAT family N-acetyltransferase [Lachnospiraceae bacterium]MBQ7777259.1 GNAT family N-acetyltransferase [Lachnospiraceae bacterium]
MYQVINNYRKDEVLRRSFNELAGKTFGLNFEPWYQRGFWGENYNPYSIVLDGKVVANVSVNKTDMVINGEVKHFLQLGTVMTDEAYRNRGLSRCIMEQIMADYENKMDGMYLFGNDNVLEFYPKFGFVPAKEYLYTKKVANTGECRLEKIVMDNEQAWKLLVEAIKGSTFPYKMYMINNPELIMFYVSSFMKESVYYHKDSDTYVIAEVEGENLFIHNVFSGRVQDLETVIGWFGQAVKEVTLGFAPWDGTDYNVAEFHEEDCTFFVRGEQLAVMEREKLRIPSLSHA